MNLDNLPNHRMIDSEEELETLESGEIIRMIYNKSELWAVFERRIGNTYSFMVMSKRGNEIHSVRSNVKHLSFDNGSIKFNSFYSRVFDYNPSNLGFDKKMAAIEAAGIY